MSALNSPAHTCGSVAAVQYTTRRSVRFSQADARPHSPCLTPCCRLQHSNCSQLAACHTCMHAHYTCHMHLRYSHAAFHSRRHLRWSPCTPTHLSLQHPPSTSDPLGSPHLSANATSPPQTQARRARARIRTRTRRYSLVSEFLFATVMSVPIGMIAIVDQHLTTRPFTYLGMAYLNLNIFHPPVHGSRIGSSLLSWLRWKCIFAAVHERRAKHALLVQCVMGQRRAHGG